MTSGAARFGRSTALVLAGVVAAAALAVDVRPAEAQIMDDATYTYLSFDRLEYLPGAPARPIELAAEGWVGGDFDRLWIKVDGEVPTVGSDGTAIEIQTLYGRLIAPFWDAQVGVRFDLEGSGVDRATRAHLALGVEGLSPYWFEVDPTLFISTDGDVSARLEASYQLFATQRLVFEPRLETNLALWDVEEFGIGRGLTGLEVSGRLRYEIVRELAPYVGVTWRTSTGATADLAHAADEDVGETRLVAGLRWWW